MSSLNRNLFPRQVPEKPTGHYAHIIAVRVTDSYPLFQTDGELNTARVAAGLQDPTPMTRITLFKRKQTTPERLVGRELLRHYGLLDPQKCDYNVAFCTECPDCIIYGFAIGDSGSEKSKVITDTAYSLTSYEHSHEAFTLNAPYENGTMSRDGEVTSRINEQDHVVPQVFFPSVITTRDLTENLFLYVVNNVLRTKRYGAQTTRTGRMQNHIVAIVLADGEIFSNLRFTQALYDKLRDQLTSPDPLQSAVVLDAAQRVIDELLASETVSVKQTLTGDDLNTFLSEVRNTNVQELLNKAFEDSRDYRNRTRSSKEQKSSKKKAEAQKAQES